MFLHEELKKRNVPDILVPNMNWEQRRIEILELLAREEYGNSPKGAFNVTSEIVSYSEKDYAGKASSSQVKIKVNTDEGLFTFPIYQFVPNNVEKPPVFLHIAFRDNIPDEYMPVEEILDNGFALVMFCYNDITLDKRDDFTSGVAKMYSRKKYSWGKIAMWAWAASRVMDYLQTYTRLDLDNVAVIGHSRLGKTALWCGANDTRFKYVFANDSGCSGDAITRGKTGEHIADITHHFDYWFCDEYKKYIGNEDALPFDQHFLVAAIAPRYVYCGAAIDDAWADPYSQFLSYYAASEVYESLGMKPLSCADKYPEAGDTFADGDIGYHLRSGSHYLSRYDWGKYMSFMKGCALFEKS